MNEQLRAHVTRVGFDLQISRTAIAVLVYLNLLHQDKVGERSVVRYQYSTWQSRYIDQNWIVGFNGLQKRGLLTHHFSPYKHYHGKNLVECPAHDPRNLKDFYTITKAGQAVIVLLKEAGLYEEYAKAIIPAYQKREVDTKKYGSRVRI